MNQAASATRRPAGSTANTGCCPMFNTTPFFVNTFTPQTAPLIPPPPPAGHCFLGTQAPQIHLPSNQQQQQQSAAAALTLQPPLISQQQQQQQQSQLQQQQSSGAPPLSGSNNIQQQQQQQRQQTQQQPQPSRLQDLSNNYNTSAPITAPGLSLQQLLASRHSASNCMALAAALASASFPHFQQLQQAQQQQQQQQLHQSTPINQSTSTSNSSNPVQSPPSLNATNTPVTNQVPLLNFNSYNSAQPFLSSQALHSTAPAAAHLNTHPNTHLGALNTTTQNIVGNQPTVPQGGLPIANTTSSNLTLEQNQQQQQHRQPLTTNMNNVSNQPTNYRVNATQAPINTMPTAHPNQQLRQVNRNILNDEALNTLLNDQFQTILLNQLFANHQFTPSVTVPAPAPAQQQARVSSNPNRPLQQQQQSTLDQAPVVVSSSQQNAARIVPQQQPSTQEPVSEQQQQQQQQAFQAQPTRMTQVPMADPYVTSNAANSTSNGGYQAQQQQQQQHTGLVNHHHLQHHQPSAVPEPVPQFQAQQPPQQQAPPASQQQRQQQQQPQPIPPMPFYSFPQMEQALALLTNPQVANNIFSHVFNIYFQNGMRTEPLHTHHHHHAPHHFHHHLHGAHHHHHGPNGPANGQDVTMPLDSLAISESKPRGLNRAEIDSLTPYIHMNEKDSRTCVICLSKFELKSKIRPLPCNHAFHAKCVDKWLRANRTCPICRRDALKTYGPKIKRV